MSTQPPLNRRFLPVPLETTFRTHKRFEAPPTPPESSLGTDGGTDDKENPSVEAGKTQSNEGPSPPPIRRQLPQPIETTRRSNRVVESTLHFEDPIPSTTTELDWKEITQVQDDASTPRPLSSAVAQPPQSPTSTHLKPLTLTASPRPRPRFTPQLIETTRRSKRVAQPYTGPEASSISSDRSDTTGTPTPRSAVVPHHKLTIWTPPLPSQAPAQGQRRPKARPLDGRSDLLTPQDSRASSLPPPLRPYRQGSMRPHLNTRMNTRAGSNMDTSTPTGTPGIVLQGFCGDKQLFSNDESWDITATPSASASDRPRDDSYSSTPSLSGSYDSSSQSQSDSQFINQLSSSQHLARTRESCDDRYSGYLLDLAARAAEAQLQEKQLKEQVESSFPNRDFCYEPVSHWGPGEDEESRANTQSSKDFSTVDVKDEVATLRLAEESDEESDDGFEGPPELPHEMLGRKESAQAKHVVDLGNGILLGIPEPVPISSEAGMTMEEIMAHEAELVRLRAEETFRLVAEEAAAPSFVDPFWTNGTSKKVLEAAAELRGDEKKRDEELKIMREAASPPMLGADLVFRTCPSPQRTRCETDQRHAVPVPKDDKGGGLWGGYCVSDGKGDRKDQVKRGPQLLETPLETPFNERADSGTVGAQAHNFLPLTEGALVGNSKGNRPAHSRMTSGGLHLLNGLDQRLQAEVAKAKREEKIKEEFDDKFVTQVYNYLSLGWPLLARDYDDELSHISGVDQEELRANDEAGAVGNIGLKRVSWASEDSAQDDTDYGDENTEIRENARWRALKRYIHEWARQHPDLEGEGRNWGDEASRRKGSWAF